MVSDPLFFSQTLDKIDVAEFAAVRNPVVGLIEVCIIQKKPFFQTCIDISYALMNVRPLSNEFETDE